MWLGTYERDYPRSRVLIEGLREIGVDVVEHHRPVWEATRHKAGSSFLRPLPLATAAARFASAWAGLAAAGLRERPVDAVVAGYLAQPDTLPAWCVARARGVPLVVDMMISLADTLGGDRAMAGRGAAAVLAGVDRVSLRLADLVLADTARGRRLARGPLRHRALPRGGGAGGRRARSVSPPSRSPRRRRTPCSTASSPPSTASPPCSPPRGGRGRRRSA